MADTSEVKEIESPSVVAEIDPLQIKINKLEEERLEDTKRSDQEVDK